MTRQPVALDAVRSLAQLEPLARAAMSEEAWAYVADVAEEGVTADREARSFAQVLLRSRVLVDVSTVSTAATVLGQPVAVPVLAAPTSLQGLAHPDGEVATVTGCAAAGTLAVISSGGSRALGDVGAVAAPWWFQLYVFADRGLTREVIDRAVAAGARALVLTVDVPVLGRRTAGLQSVHSDAAHPALLRSLVQPGESWEQLYRRTQSKPVTWDELEWFREVSPVPVVLKGVLDPGDAARAAAAGVDALVVSTHGGRQLDGAPAPLEVLPAVAAAVDGRAEVYADGSVRRGSHVLRLLARGADAVLVGRPAVWGLACGGADGVRRVMELLAAELATAMALTGCCRVADVGPDVEWRP